MNIGSIKNIFQQKKGEFNHIQKELESYKEQSKLKDKELKLIEEAQVFLQKIAQQTQEQLRYQIEDIVNLALETCFPNEYEFQIVFDIKYGKTVADLIFLSKRTGRLIDPMNASGGGVIDLTSFALRIACYALEQGTDNVIILDEPFRFLSRDLQSRAGEILKTLSERMNIQIIMVTHIGEIIDIADKVFEVKKNSEGVSNIFIKNN